MESEYGGLTVFFLLFLVLVRMLLLTVMFSQKVMFIVIDCLGADLWENISELFYEYYTGSIKRFNLYTHTGLRSLKLTLASCPYASPDGLAMTCSPIDNSI